MNAGRNYNGPMVGSCHSKTRLYAGNSAYPTVLVTLLCGSENQIGEPYFCFCNSKNYGQSAGKILPSGRKSSETIRLAANLNLDSWKIWSELYGDIQSTAEMSVPP